MRLDPPSDATIREILCTRRRIALVGASAKPWRDSHHVMAFLLRQGHDVTPVNPHLAGQTIHDRAVVPDLSAAAPLDMVDVFRASQHAGGVVDDAIRLGARMVWLQLGVIDQDAAARARAAGLIVVMDRCPVIEARRLGLSIEAKPDPRHMPAEHGRPHRPQRGGHS
jgi:predicted CoA-binding protein